MSDARYSKSSAVWKSTLRERVWKSLSVVILSTADWRADLWTNKQHTARALRDEGVEVLYVESLALRMPSLAARDRRRIARRISRALRPPVEVEPRIWVWSPLVIPLHQFAIIRIVNRLYLSALLRLWVRWLRLDKPLMWTYNPITTALVWLPHRSQLVYHCVDNVAVQPGVRASVVNKFEQRLVELADYVFVSSRDLEARWSKVRDVVYEPNCVDVEHFAAPSGQNLGDPFGQIPKPRVGFVGAVSSYKLDSELLLDLGIANPAWSIVIIGPREDDDDEISRFLSLPNVYHIGRVDYVDLPLYMWNLDVGIIPARINAYTKAMFPMKFFEYLAAGLPVVCTKIPALTEFQFAASMVDRSEFGKAVVDVLHGNYPAKSQRDRAIDNNTYRERTQRMLHVVRSEGSRADTYLTGN